MLKWLSKNLALTINVTRVYFVISTALFIAVGTPAISTFPQRLMYVSFIVAGSILFFNFNRLSMKGQLRATSEDDEKTLKSIKAQANLFIAFGFFLLGSGLLGIISGNFSNLTLLGFNIPLSLITGTIKAKQEIFGQ